jgi:hypothetical protein
VGAGKPATLPELVGRIDGLIALLETQDTGRSAQTQHVVYESKGVGGLQAAALTACFLTYLSLIIFAIWSIFQINNLTAWEGVYGRDLAAIKQAIQHPQEKAH